MNNQCNRFNFKFDNYIWKEYKINMEVKNNLLHISRELMTESKSFT